MSPNMKDNILKNTRPKLSEILDITLATLGVDIGDWEIHSRSRQQWIVKVKEVYCLLAYEYGYSHTQIGNYIKCHRTTVIHYIKALRGQCRIYQKWSNLVEKARTSLKPFVKKGQLEDVSHGYLARSSTGMLIISPIIPSEFCGYWIAEGSRPYATQSAFPQITKETGPVKVKIKVIIEDHE